MTTVAIAEAVVPEGIVVDPDAKRLTVLGDDVMVAWAMCWHNDENGLVNFTILCGENGWFVNLALNVCGEYAGSMFGDAADWRFGDYEATTAEELADLIAEVSCRTRPLPAWMDEWHRDPFAGCEPGTWLSFDVWDWPA